MTGNTGSKESGDMSADGDIQGKTNNTGPSEGDTTGGAESRTAESRTAEPRTAEPKAGGSAGDGPDQEAATEASSRSELQAAVPEGVLPNKAAEDDPRRWGDQPDNYDHDAWLQEQKPPHWG
jgi:hypothetical protein